jgi:hypothetical protein
VAGKEKTGHDAQQGEELWRETSDDLWHLRPPKKTFSGECKKHGGFSHVSGLALELGNSRGSRRLPLQPGIFGGNLKMNKRKMLLSLFSALLLIVGVYSCKSSGQSSVNNGTQAGSTVSQNSTGDSNTVGLSNSTGAYAGGSAAVSGSSAMADASDSRAGARENVQQASADSSYSGTGQTLMTSSGSKSAASNTSVTTTSTTTYTTPVVETTAPPVVPNTTEVVTTTPVTTAEVTTPTVTETTTTETTPMTSSTQETTTTTKTETTTHRRMHKD